MTNNLNNYFRIKRSTALFCFYSYFKMVFAAIRLPNTISSNMVLQQKQPCPHFGMGKALPKKDICYYCGTTKLTR